MTTIIIIIVDVDWGGCLTQSVFGNSLMECKTASWRKRLIKFNLFQQALSITLNLPTGSFASLVLLYVGSETDLFLDVAFVSQINLRPLQDSFDQETEYLASESLTGVITFDAENLILSNFLVNLKTVQIFFRYLAGGCKVPQLFLSCRWP